MSFMWSDLNGDGEVRAQEVKLWEKREEQGVTMFDNALSIQAGKLRFQVKEFLPNGVPIYQKKEFPKLWSGPTPRLSNGNFWHLEARRKGSPAGVLGPDGTPIWTYKRGGSGGYALYYADPYTPDQVISQFGWVGHEIAHKGDIGEFVVFNSNVGT